MAALYEERNRALREQLGARLEALSRSQASLAASQDERSELQRKVRELQENLSRAEAGSEGPPSPPGEGVQDPSGAAHNGPRPPWGAPSPHPAPASADTQPSLEHLRRSAERFAGLNRLLSGALQECKAGAEGISLLLGRQESHHGALTLALRDSEQCLEAYETLWALTAVGQEAPWPGPPKDPSPALEKALRILPACSAAPRGSWEQDGAQDSPRRLAGSEADARRRLREHVGRLRAERGSLKPPSRPPPPGLAAVAARLRTGIAAKVAEGRRAVREALPGSGPARGMEKGQLPRELRNAREALADLSARLHLAAKEKQRLALCAHPTPARGAACLLLIGTLQWERRGLQRQPPPSSGSGASSEDSSGPRAGSARGGPRGPLPAAPTDTEGGLARTEPEAPTLRLLEASARVRALKDHLSALLIDLEEKIQNCRAYEAQQMELVQDFLQAHSALLLAYQKARRKMDTQMEQLDAQAGLMGRRQAKQRQALAHVLRRLQNPLTAGAPTGRAHTRAPPASEETPRLDRCGGLEGPSF